MPLNGTSKYKNKYNFDLLAIGESMFVPGAPSRIRTAACMWGTRYGVWLSTKKKPGGVEVTRLESPIRITSKQKISVQKQLNELKDALRFISLMLIDVKKKTDEL